MQEDKRETQTEEKKVYEPPAIIYEGIISTRAGTPALGLAPDQGPGINPEDLFGK